MNQNLISIVLLFSFYSMSGWVIESIFKSVLDRKFVNSGFLTGPFCPIYGFGALLVIQSAPMSKHFYPQANTPTQIIISILIAIILTSLLEYLAGMIIEILFDSKWWDYCNEKFNLHGRVCLKYSVYWGILAYVMLSLVNPYIQSGVYMLPSYIKSLLACAIIFYFSIDLVLSINEADDLREHIAAYGNQFSFEKLFRMHKRLISAFPQLYINIANRPAAEFKSSINKMEQLYSIDEFRMCIDDLIANDYVRKMQQFRHHYKVSCLDHSLNVSLTSFKICRALGMDYISAARGGLLHDLFLYDWRTCKPDEGMHGFVHPRISLNNALKVCSLNEIEKDIILKHMFPLTWSLPHYKESIIVCLIDKYCAFVEIYLSILRSKSLPNKTMAIVNDVNTISGMVKNESCNI